VHDPTTACIRIVSMENQNFGNNTTAQVVCIHELQSKAWGSPAREMTKISKKKTWKGLILKGDMGFWSD
jgi:hypothetical protein